MAGSQPTEKKFEIVQQPKQVAETLPSELYIPEYDMTVKTDYSDPFVVRYLAGRRGMNIPRENWFGMENLGESHEKIANGIINQAVRGPANIVASGAMSTYRQAVGMAKSAMDMGRRDWELFGLEQEQNDELIRLQQLKTEGKISESDYMREKGRIEDEYIKKSTAIHQKFLEADRISNEQMARLKKAGEEWLAEVGIARTDRDGFVYDLFGGATSLAVGIGLFLVSKSPAAAGAVFGVVTGRDNYEEALENGKSRETAAQVGLWSGFAQAALEGFGAEQIAALPRAVKAAKAAKVATQAAKTATAKTPTQAFFQEFGEQATAKWLKSSGIGARATYSAFTEAAEEGVQNVADDGIMTMWGGREKDIKSILTDAIYSAVIGGITGGFAGGVRGAFDKVSEKAQERKEEQAKKTADKSQPKSENEKKGELPKTSEIKPIELENPKVVKETTQQPQQIDTEAARSVIEGHSFDTAGNLRDAEGKIVKTAGDMEDTHKSRIYMYQLLREATVRKLMSEIGMNRKAAGIFADKALAQAADIVQNTIPQLIDNELNEATFDGRKAEIAAELKAALQKIGKERPLNKQFNSELDEVYKEYYEYGKQNGLNDTQAEYMGRWQRTRIQVYSMFTGMSPKYLSEQMRIGLSNKGKPVEGATTGKSPEAGMEESQEGRTLNQSSYNETGSFGKTIKQFFGVAGRGDKAIYKDILEALNNPKDNVGKLIDLGYVPDIYAALGFNGKELKATRLTFLKANGKLSKAQLKKYKTNNHNVPKKILRNIGTLIADPLIIIESNSVPGRLLAVLDASVFIKGKGHLPVVVAISPEPKGGGFAFIPSIYEHKKLVKQINDADKKYVSSGKSGILYIDKKRVPRCLAYGVKPQPLSTWTSLAHLNTPINSILSKEDIVKRFGLTDENNSQTLTQPESSQSGIDDNSARGSVTFENNSLNALVELFKGADTSTLPHELAHVFLMDMQRLAALNPNGRLAGMFEDLREAIGEPEGEIPGTYSSEQQEHFAKMWERYLAEEHAPTKAWQRVFSVFKEWLRGVYKTFKDFPELSPAAKSLFDKWLSFDDTNNIPNTEELKEYKEKTNALKEVAEAAKENRDTETDGITVQDVKAVLNITRMERPEEPEAVKAYNETLAIVDSITENQAEAENILDRIEDMEYKGARQLDERDLELIDKAIADIQAIEDNPDIEIPGITDTQEEAEEQPGSETADRPEIQPVQKDFEEKRELPGTYILKEQDGTYSLKGSYYIGSYYKSGRIKEARGWEEVRESGTIATGFRTREEAENFASRLAEMQEPLPQSNGAKADRTGLPRRPKHSQTGQALLEGLGFKAVKTGRDLTKKDENRLMNALYDGVYDLAEVLNIPPESLSLNGTLTVKLGAPKTDIKPGQGAYYRAKDKAIIMDSEAGSGRFAAAWYAAFTDYMKSPDIRPEMAEAFSELAKAIHSRELTDEEVNKEYEARLQELADKQTEILENIRKTNSAELVSLADEVMEADYLDAYPIPMEDLFEEKHETREYGADNRIIDEALRYGGEQGAMLISDLVALHNQVIDLENMDFRAELGTDSSRFARDYATAIGKSTQDTKDADVSAAEKDAAAFASYIHYWLGERGGRNTFLTRPEGGKTFNVRRAVAERVNTEAKPGEAGDPFAYPYPVGRERQAIFNAFDKVFSTLKYETTESGKVRLYQEGDSGITFFQDKKDIVVKNYTDRENPSRITQREIETFLPEEKAAFESFLARKETAERERILKNLQEHKYDDKGKITGYYKLAIEGIFIQEAIERYFAGEEIDFESAIDKRTKKGNLSSLKNVLEGGDFKAAKTDDSKIDVLIYKYLKDSILSKTEKAGWCVNSSLLNCNPSAECAKYCYATKGRHYTSIANLPKAEVIDFIVRKAPDKIARELSHAWKHTYEYTDNKALRLFDKGDGNKYWVYVIEKLNEAEVRVAVFTKKPDFMREVKKLRLKDGTEINLSMLSVDASNEYLANENKDLNVAYVYQGEQNLEFVKKLQEEDRLSVVFPVKLGSRLMPVGKVEKLVSAGINNELICKYDAGGSFNKDNEFVPVQNWKCTLCDNGGGCGCYFDKTTKEIRELIQRYKKGESSIISLAERLEKDPELKPIKEFFYALAEKTNITDREIEDRANVLFGKLDTPYRRAAGRLSLIFDRTGYRPDTLPFAKSDERKGDGDSELSHRMSVGDNGKTQVVYGDGKHTAGGKRNDNRGVPEKLSADSGGQLLNPDEDNSGQTLYQSAKNNLPETIDIDGEQKPTTNSEGRPIAATEEGVRNFYKWYGESVFYENGRPKVFYHNTNAEFEEFKKDKIGTATDLGWMGRGFYFYGSNYEGVNYGKNQMPVYLKVENPYFITYEEHERLIEASDNGDIGVIEEFTENLKEDGYDSVYDAENLRQECCVFEPGQIKSVENTGAFDPGNPNIFYQPSKEPDRFRREDYAWAFRKTGDNRYAISKINSVIGSLMKELQKRKIDPETKERITRTLRSAIGYKGYLTRVRQARSLVDKAIRNASGLENTFTEMRPKPVLTEEKDAELIQFHSDPKNKEKVLRKAGVQTWWEELKEKYFTDPLTKVARSVSDRAEKISPRLKLAFREFARNFNMQRTAHVKAIEPFLKAYHAMEEDDKLRFDYAAFNGDTDTIEKLKKKYENLAPALETYRNVLNEIYVQAAEAGFEVGYIQDYFPRKVKYPVELINHIKGTDEWTFIERWLKQQLKVNDPDGWINAKEHQEVIADMISRQLHTTGFAGQGGTSKPGNIKKRRIFEVTKEMMSFYYDSAEAAVMYAAEMDRAIQARKFFGYDLQHEEESISMVIADIIEDRKAAKAKDPSVKLLTAKEERELFRDIQSVMHPIGPGNIGRSIKTWGYMFTLVDYASTLTQLEDLSVSFVENGIGRTLASVTGKKITLEDIGVEIYDPEINSLTGMSKYLNTALKATGFSKMDRFGKETFILSDFKKRAEQVKKDRQGFIEECEMYGYEAGRIKNMIASFEKGDVNALNDDAKSLLFYDLAEVQPIDMAEMPELYLRGENWRIAYALKTFTLKRLNYLIEKSRRLALQGKNLWDKGDKAAAMEAWLKGIGTMTWTMFLLVSAGASLDWLKDLIFGRQTDIPSVVVDNMLKQASFNRWEIKRVIQDPADMMIAKIYPPLIAMGQDLITDLTRVLWKDTLEMKDIRLWNNIPIVGRLYYWRFGGGKLLTEKQKEKEARKRRTGNRRRKESKDR